MAVPAHEREEAAVLGAHRIDLAPASQEMVIDQPDHMEAVGHDHRIGKLELDDGAVHRRQVHADDADLLFTKVTKYAANAASERPKRNIVNAVIFQIAEGGCVTLLASEEVLVDSQIWGQTGA